MLGVHNRFAAGETKVFGGIQKTLAATEYDRYEFILNLRLREGQSVA